ncbi:MAG: UDP-3-O-acyl-N-acetylglucosamine deacetylase [Thermodesulfobacteriota bacterium]
MRNLLQRTIQDAVTCTGIGLHSGEKIKLTLYPAPEDSGVVIHRTDLPGSPGVKACLENVVHTRLATTLGQDGVVIGTVEHLLSTLAGLGIDNVRVEVSGPEIPVMDGSSAPFVYLLKSGGVRLQSRYKKFCLVTRPVLVQEGDKLVMVEPGREFSVHYSISFDHPLIRNQSLEFKFSDVAFERELSRARTFGFLHEVEYLKKNGFARGGSLANAVVVDRFRILNQDGLRYEDEFIRHKILDFIGDISLMGVPIIGRFTAVKSGHTLNHVLMTKLKAAAGAWRLVEFTDPSHCRAQNVMVPSWGLLDQGAHQAAA